MSLKRGNLPQMTKDGAGFIGSGGIDDTSEAPTRATAAQLAGRKIKTPRSRTGAAGGFGASGGASSFSSFGQSSAPAQAAPQQPQSSSSFNFSMPQSSNNTAPQFGQQAAGGGSGGFSGSMFSVPPSNTNTNAGSTSNSFPPSGGQSSGFSFGSNNNSNPFGKSQQPQIDQSAANSGQNLFDFNAAASSTSTPFGASSEQSKPPLFGQTTNSTNLFGQPTSSSQDQSRSSQSPAPPSSNPFATQSSAPSSQSLFAPAAASSTTSQAGLFGTAPSTSSNLFAKSSSSNSPAATSNPFPPPNTDSQTNSLFGKEPATSDQSQQSNLFSTKSAPEPSKSLFGAAQPSDSKSMFGASQGTSTSIFGSAQKATPASASSISDASKPAASLFGKSSQSNTSTLFGTATSSSSPAVNSQNKTSLFGSNDQNRKLTPSESVSTPALTTEDSAKPSSSLFAGSNAKPSTSLFAAPEPVKEAPKPAPTAASDSSLFGAKSISTPVSSNASASTKAAAPSLFSVDRTINNQAQANGLAEKSTTPNFLDLFANKRSQTVGSNGSATMPSERLNGTNFAVNSTIANAVSDFASDIRVPEPPAHFNEQQKFQWPYVWKLKVLTEKLQADVSKLSKTDALATQELIEAFKTDASYIKDALKRKAPEDGTPARPAKRINTGAQSADTAFQQSNNTSSGTANSLSTSNKPDATANSVPSLFFGAKSASATPVAASQTDQVTYPNLPPASAPKQSGTLASGSNEPPKFQVPKFGGGGGGGNFLAQFGAQAKKTEAEEAKKRQDEDYDSEEEDLESWKKRDAEKRAAEKAKYDAISKNSSLGFQFNAPGGKTSASSTASTSLFSQPNAPAPTTSGLSSSTSNLFASAAKSTAPSADKPLFSFAASTGATAPFSSSAQSGAGAGTFQFGSSTPAATFGNKGSLFDRIEKDKDGNVAKELADNTFKGDSNTPIKFKPLPANLAPASIASDTSRATTPATGGEETDNTTGDDETPKEAQLDLTHSGVGEEDEDVLVEVRAKGSELVKNKDGKADWVVRGVGQLKLLRNKNTRKTRILLRSSPAAKIIFNSQLLKTTKYVPSGPKNNTVRVPVVTGDGKIQQFVLMVKEAKDAANLASQMEENKNN